MILDPSCHQPGPTGSNTHTGSTPDVDCLPNLVDIGRQLYAVEQYIGHSSRRDHWEPDMDFDIVDQCRLYQRDNPHHICILLQQLKWRMME